MSSWEGFFIAILVMIVAIAVWRPFRAVALLLEAKANHWNALAEKERSRSRGD